MSDNFIGASLMNLVVSVRRSKTSPVPVAILKLWPLRSLIFPRTVDDGIEGAPCECAAEPYTDDNAIRKNPSQRSVIFFIGSPNGYDNILQSTFVECNSSVQNHDSPYGESTNTPSEGLTVRQFYAIFRQLFRRLIANGRLMGGVYEID